MCKFVLGLLIKSVNFFQDETLRTRFENPPSYAIRTGLNIGSFISNTRQHALVGLVFNISNILNIWTAGLRVCESAGLRGCGFAGRGVSVSASYRVCEFLCYDALRTRFENPPSYAIRTGLNIGSFISNTRQHAQVGRVSNTFNIPLKIHHPS